MLLCLMILTLWRAATAEAPCSADVHVSVSTDQDDMGHICALLEEMKKAVEQECGCLDKTASSQEATETIRCTTVMGTSSDHQFSTVEVATTTIRSMSVSDSTGLPAADSTLSTTGILARTTTTLSLTPTPTEQRQTNPSIITASSLPSSTATTKPTTTQVDLSSDNNISQWTAESRTTTTAESITWNDYYSSAINMEISASGSGSPPDNLTEYITTTPLVHAANTSDVTFGITSRANATDETSGSGSDIESTTTSPGDDTTVPETGALDVVFLLDGSGSIGQRRFNVIKQWTINQTLAIYDKFGSPAQVGVIQYSSKEPDFLGIEVADSTEFRTPLTLAERASDEVMVRNRITSMEYLNKSTYTAFGLKRATEVEFPLSSRFPDARRIIVVVTDGEADDGSEISDWWDQYGDTDWIVPFAIGVENYDQSQIHDIANGGKSDDRVFELNSFQDLSKLKMENIIHDEIFGSPNT